MYECCGLVQYPHSHTKGLVRVSPKNKCQLHTLTFRDASSYVCNWGNTSRTVHGGGRAEEENWNRMDPKPLIGWDGWMDILELYEAVVWLVSQLFRGVLRWNNSESTRGEDDDGGTGVDKDYVPIWTCASFQLR